MVHTCGQIFSCEDLIVISLIVIGLIVIHLVVIR